LEVSKLGLPVNHSGQNVIQLEILVKSLTSQALATTHIPAIQLSSAQNNDPIVTGRVIIDNLPDDVAAHRCST
jgi:hypothetical protein